MNRTWTWLTVVVAAGCSPTGGQEGPEGAAQATVDSAQVATEVQAFLAEYLTAIEARDEEAVRNRLLSERYRWVEDGEVRYRHVEDVLESLAQFPSGMPIRTSIAGLEVTPIAGGRGAHVVGGFTTEVGSGDGAFAFGGVITFVLERTDGTWRVVGGHTSSPRPDAQRGDTPGEG